MVDCRCLNTHKSQLNCSRLFICVNDNENGVFCKYVSSVSPVLVCYMLPLYNIAEV